MSNNNLKCPNCKGKLTKRLIPKEMMLDNGNIKVYNCFGCKRWYACEEREILIPVKKMFLERIGLKQYVERLRNEN